eukprot:345049-Hanusia_phi.AAC.3
MDVLTQVVGCRGDGVGGGTQRCRIGKCRGGRMTLWGGTRKGTSEQTRRNLRGGGFLRHDMMGVGSAQMP